MLAGSSRVNFSMKYFRNKLLSSTRQDQITCGKLNENDNCLISLENDVDSRKMRLAQTKLNHECVLATYILVLLVTYLVCNLIYCCSVERDRLVVQKSDDLDECGAHGGREEGLSCMEVALRGDGFGTILRGRLF